MLRPQICYVLSLPRIQSRDSADRMARLTCGDESRKRLEELNGRKQQCSPLPKGSYMLEPFCTGLSHVIVRCEVYSHSNDYFDTYLFIFNNLAYKYDSPHNYPTEVN
jgi:Fe-S-cluster containining protein